MSFLKNKSHLVILSCIIFVSFLVRLYRIDRPLADWHSWRQTDTASVTREFIKTNTDILHPQYHDLSNIPSGKDNLLGYRMVEFPFVNYVLAKAYAIESFGLELHVYSRVFSIFASLGAIIFVYAIVADLVSKRAAVSAAFIFGLLPYNIFYHTTVLPEVPLLFFSLMALYFWIRYVQKPTFFAITLFAISASLAMLLKPIFVFLGLAMLYLLILKKGLRGLFDWKIWVAAIVVIAPILWWRNWIHGYPEGIPASSWLFNGSNIRFKGAFFRWLFADRLGRLLFGYWGLVLVVIGIIRTPTRKAGWFFHYLILGMLIYLSVFATGNVTHDYYQIFIVPYFCMVAGLGLDFLIFEAKKINGIHPFFARISAVVIVSFMVAFGWFHIRDYFNINNMLIVEAGEFVDDRLPEDALVIAPYGGDTAFLYQTNRRGWPIGYDIADKIEMGATHYVSTSYDDEARMLESACTLIEKNDRFIVIDLNGCLL